MKMCHKCILCMFKILTLLILPHSLQQEPLFKHLIKILKTDA